MSRYKLVLYEQVKVKANFIAACRKLGLKADSERFVHTLNPAYLVHGA